MIVADGSIGHLYIETSKKFPNSIVSQLPPATHLCYIPPTRGKSDRRGEKGTLAFLEYCCSPRVDMIRKGELGLSDNESSFKTEWVRDFENDKGKYFVVSPYCDCL